MLHALEDEVDAIDVLLFHAAQRGQNMVLFADVLFGPFHRELVVTGVGFDPASVIVGALAGLSAPLPETAFDPDAVDYYATPARQHFHHFL